jgi:mannose-6-phosphate isomerase
MSIYPILLEPIYKERIWGGRNLERIFGRRLPAGVAIGESWELADLKEGASVLGNGPGAGKTLTELVASMGGDLLGQAKPFGGRFPLLLKLLDANDILSLQVHPDAKTAAEIGGGAAPKPECWYILESRDGFIYKGLQPGVTAEQFRRALEQDKVEPLLKRFDVKAGDFHYIPAGTVHALGGGVVCAEIQSPSDTTYRVSDWGRGRETHLELSMRCIHFAPTPEPPGAGDGVLLHTENFLVAMRTAAINEPKPLPPGRFSAVMITAASAHVEVHHDGDNSPVFAVRGDTVLLPAALKNPRIVSAGRLEYLEVTLPQG